MQHESGPSGVSIFNDVLGPVMRGPSSSHTAGAFHIARIATALLGRMPSAARIAFHPEGSYGRVYAEQGADRAFACGILGWELTDEAVEVVREIFAGLPSVLKAR